MSGMITMAAVAAVGVGLSAYEISQQGSISGQALNLAQNTQNTQMYWNQQLMNLMQNPDSFLTSNVFQSSEAQGLQAVSRQGAAGGYAGGYSPSGNQLTALESYGQSQAAGQLTQQEQLLASMGGATNASSPAQSLGVASGANSASFNQLGGLLAGLQFQGATGTGLFAGAGAGGAGWANSPDITAGTATLGS